MLVTETAYLLVCGEQGSLKAGGRRKGKSQLLVLEDGLMNPLPGHGTKMLDSPTTHEGTYQPNTEKIWMAFIQRNFMCSQNPM